MSQEAPVSLQLEKFIPPDCAGCETAFSVCVAAAQRIKKEDLNLHEVGAEISGTISQNCPGELRRAAGWAATEKVCRMA